MPLFRSVLPQLVRGASLLLPSVLMAAGSASAQDLAPYDLVRVGPEIDREELAYFDLFSREAPATHARVLRAADGALHFEVAREGRSDTTYVLAPEAAGVLETYLDRYEHQAEIEALDYAVLYPYTRYRVMHTEGFALKLTLVSGEEIEGEVLYLGDDRLYLQTDPAPFDWRRMAEQALVVRYEDVSALETARSRAQAASLNLAAALALGGSSAALSAGTLALSDEPLASSLPTLVNVGVSAALAGYSATRTVHSQEYTYGSAEAARAFLTPRRGEVAFWIAPSPGLTALMPEAVTPDPRFERREGRVGVPVSRFHLMAGGLALAGGDGAFAGRRATGAAVVDFGGISKPPAAWFADVAVGLTHHLRLGVNATAMPAARDEPWAVHASGSTLAAYAEYDLLGYDPSLETVPGRFFASAAAGYGRATTETRLALAFEPALLGIDPELRELPAERTTSHTAYGPFGRAAFGYYFSRHLSAQAQVTVQPQSAAPGEGERRDYAVGTSSGMIYTWDAYEVTLPAVQLFVGMRLHL